MRREKEKAYVSSICLDLKPPYVVEVAAKPYLLGYVALIIQQFNNSREN